MGNPDGFRSFGLGPKILKGIADAGFVEPRPIQAASIGAALEGRDILGLAQTGTGKTAAFSLPLMERLLARRGSGPRVLILAPTRELATQIHAEIEVLAKHTGLRSVTVFGGVSPGRQIRGLAGRPDFVVACPGRLLDLYGQGEVDLSRIESLVLDEADHMLDMGFLPSIRKIISALPKRRQNLLFSATMPREIREFADAILHDPKRVELAHSAPADTIEHALYPVRAKDKVRLLETVLDEEGFTSAIVFLRTKHRAKQLAKHLSEHGHRAVALQGNMSQPQRVRAMDGFRAGKFDVLVATDIAARGIDVAKVSHVVNFDVPGTPDAYTHRIGRTGRAEMSGKALTFVTHEDFPAIKDIEKRIGAAIPRVKLKGFESDEDERVFSERRGSAGAGGGRGRGRSRGRGRGGPRGGGGGGSRSGAGGGGRSRRGSGGRAR